MIGAQTYNFDHNRSILLQTDNLDQYVIMFSKEFNFKSGLILEYIYIIWSRYTVHHIT